MTDLVDRIRKELDARIEQLRPLVDEFERLQHAATALARAGARAVPGVGRPPAATKPASRSAPKPAARRRVTAPPRTPAPAAPEREPADRPSPPKAAARRARARRRGTATRRPPAPRGQTQAKVLAALRAAPGSTTQAVATAAGIPTNTTSATISRLVKQGRVRRLDGGYAPVEPPSDAAPPAAASDAREAQAPVPTDTPARE
jgi:hypothetical protein